jgi:hypothetical protein
VTASITGEELVLVLGAYSALVVAAFGMLIKFVLDTRRATTETNRAVNNRPVHDPTIRELVEDLHGDMRDLRRVSDRRHDQVVERHKENVRWLGKLDNEVQQVKHDLRQHMSDLDERNGGTE